MIIVSPLSAAQTQIDIHGARHVISLLGPDMPHRSFTGIAAVDHLKLTFHDVVENIEGYAAPGQADAERLISFIGAWDRSSPLLIHCWAGISRSTASAFVALCMLHPELDEKALAHGLRAASPSATPNRLIVELADGLLKREGRMLRAVLDIGRGANASEGKPFILRP
jgi:predicted protein tyrosine phosphatase